MESPKNKPTNLSQMESQRQRWLEALYNVETFFRENGCSDFEYDEELDVFRFPEDGRFAFCNEFANWDLLQERGYMVDF